MVLIGIEIGKEINTYCNHINSRRVRVNFLSSQDSVWGGTGSSSLYQSNHTSGQQQRFETVTSGKKKKKQKMVRADPSLLGESKHPFAKSENIDLYRIIWINLHLNAVQIFFLAHAHSFILHSYI